jgi:hypothetical protein
MLEQINEYFNNNRTIGLILAISLLVIVLWIYNSCNCLVKESFGNNDNNNSNNSNNSNNNSTQICNCSPPQDETFYSQYVLGHTNMVNFKCTYNGTDYYLANMKLSECSNQEQVDCMASVLVLMPVTEVNEKLTQYFKDIQTDSDICNTTNKIKCLSNYTSPTSEQEESCSIPSASCTTKRMFNHDFNIIEAKSSSGSRKYLIKGTAVASRNSSLIPTLLNQSLYDSPDNVKNLMCSDQYDYSPLNNPEFAEVSIIERLITNSGGVIGGTNPLRIKLKFITRTYILSKDKTGKPIYMALSDPTTGKPTTRSTFVGVCPELTCNSAGKQYIRLCLYDESTNQNVLEFEPLLI